MEDKNSSTVTPGKKQVARPPFFKRFLVVMGQGSLIFFALSITAVSFVRLRGSSLGMYKELFLWTLLAVLILLVLLFVVDHVKQRGAPHYAGWMVSKNFWVRLLGTNAHLALGLITLAVIFSLNHFLLYNVVYQELVYQEPSYPPVFLEVSPFLFFCLVLPILSLCLEYWRVRRGVTGWLSQNILKRTMTVFSFFILPSIFLLAGILYVDVITEPPILLYH